MLLLISSSMKQFEISSHFVHNNEHLDNLFVCVFYGIHFKKLCNENKAFKLSSSGILLYWKHNVTETISNFTFFVLAVIFHI